MLVFELKHLVSQKSITSFTAYLQYAHEAENPQQIMKGAKLKLNVNFKVYLMPLDIEFFHCDFI